MSSNLPIAATRTEHLTRADVLATFFQGLADPTRVRVLELLAERPRTVRELQDALGLAQGRGSGHPRTRPIPPWALPPAPALTRTVHRARIGGADLGRRQRAVGVLRALGHEEHPDLDVGERRTLVATG